MEDTAIIQPKWLIDEYAIKTRIWTWLIPPSPPTIEQRIEKNKTTKNQESKKNQKKINKGANFCQVARRRQPNHLRELITEGTQKWKGNEPIFNNKPLKRIKEQNQCNEKKLKFSPREYNQKPPQRKKLLPKACTKKYLTPLSTSSTEEILINKGINDIKFNSNPIHIPIQWDEDKLIKEPKNNTKKKNNLKGNPKNIKTRMKLNHSNWS